MWLELMPRFGGIHHGYFLPSEGMSDVALAMFSFPSLAAYEQYRKDAAADPDAQKAVAFAKQTRCFVFPAIASENGLRIGRSFAITRNPSSSIQGTWRPNKPRRSAT
jgi:hypothetical protein